MKKTAQTNLQINTHIKERFSPRAFSTQLVSDEIIERIIEAARWASSAFNDQPWRFIIGSKGSSNGNYDNIFASLAEFNQVWNKNVPLFIVFSGTKISDKTGKENTYFAYDTGQAAAYATIQATEEGLYCHQMGGFDANKIKELFGLPENIVPLAVMAIGYLGDGSDLPEKFQEMEKQVRTRIPQDSLVINYSDEKVKLI